MSKFILLIPLTNRPFRTMTSFYYYDQNPLGFCFLVQIRAFVIQTSLGLQNLNIKGKNEKDYGRSSKMTPSCKWLTVDSLLTDTSIRRTPL